MVLCDDDGGGEAPTGGGGPPSLSGVASPPRWCPNPLPHYCSQGHQAYHHAVDDGSHHGDPLSSPQAHIPPLVLVVHRHNPPYRREVFGDWDAVIIITQIKEAGQ